MKREKHIARVKIIEAGCFQMCGQMAGVFNVGNQNVSFSESVTEGFHPFIQVTFENTFALGFTGRSCGKHDWQFASATVVIVLLLSFTGFAFGRLSSEQLCDNEDPQEVRRGPKLVH